MNASKTIRKHRSVAAAIALWAGAASNTWAESEWMAEFTSQSSVQGEESISIQASSILQIRLPSSVGPDQLAELALELDWVDVSSLIGLEPTEDGAYLLVYQPVTPLEGGEHELRLVQNTQSGEIIERGVWNFSVVTPPPAPELNAYGDINLRQRVAENNDAEPAGDAFSANGAAAISGQYASENFGVSADLGLVADKNEENTLQGKRLDMSHYDLTFSMGESASLSLGEQGIEHSSLVYDYFDRRGLKANAAIAALNSEIQVFSVRTTAIQGFTEGLGVGESGNQTFGFAYDMQPFSDNPEWLNINLAYLDAEMTDQDEALETGAELQSGQAYSVALDSRLMNEQIRLRGEYAETDHQYEAEGLGATEQNDSAYSLLASYQYLPPEDELNALIWNLSFEHTRVEPKFRSIANEGLTSDRLLNILSGGISQGSWSWNATYSVEEDNLDDRLAATVETTQWFTGLGYQMMSETTPWYGLPSVDLTFSSASNEEKESQAIPETDDETLVMGIAANFGFDVGHAWGISLEQSESENQISGTEDELLTFGLNATLLLSDELQLSPSWLRTETEEKNFGDETTEDSFSLGLGYFSLNHGFDINLNANWVRSDQSLGGFESDTDTTYYDLQFNKELFGGEGIFPLTTLGIAATYSETDNSDPDLEDSNPYQAFVDLKMSW